MSYAGFASLMSSNSSGISSIGSGISSILSGASQKSSAATYKQMAELSQLKTQVAERQASRQIYSMLGKTRASTAANGLKQSGSAEDVLRSNAQEGALSKGITVAQGQIEYQSYMGQYKAAKSSALGSSISGWASVAGGLSSFSDAGLKCDIAFQYMRPDGIGVYRFRYMGQPTVYEGVLADEVEAVYPEAVSVIDGFKAVNYAALNMTFPNVVEE